MPLSGHIQMRVFSGLVALICLAGAAYVYAFPPESMRYSRDGAPYFAPPVVNPDTGKPLDLDMLIRHYKGG
jgi:hypothetical protein